MRGFRASRAVNNNKSARFGKQASHLRIIEGGAPQHQHPEVTAESLKPRKLPDWLKFVNVEDPAPTHSAKSATKTPRTRSRKKSERA